VERSTDELQRSLLISRLFLDIARAFRGVDWPNENYGMHAADGMLVAAVFIGETEGRPMNASKLAEFVGVPRPTVIRRMAELARNGRVVKDGTVWRYAGPRDIEGTRRATAAAVKAIIRTAEQLSRLDT